MNNIAFIGMPGCGKSVIGKAVSDKYSRLFIDVDEYIEQHYDKISNLFKKGEKHFRDIEEESLARILDIESIVVSTGGGVVERESNIRLLKEKCVIIFIDRSPEQIFETLDASIRPLLKNNPEKLYDLYNRRYDKYLKAADYTVDNNNKLEKALQDIYNIIDIKKG